MRKIKILTTVLCLSIGLSACAESPEEKFAAAQKSLMAKSSDLTKAPPRTETADEPYIKGKIAVFNRAAIASKTKDADGKTFFMTPLYFREMPEIAAAAPEEVGTVAVVDCDSLTKGVYRTDDGREMPAEVEDCELTLIDRSKPAIILKRKFEKAPSDERRAYGNSVVRQTAQEDVLQFLKSLPRR